MLQMLITRGVTSTQTATAAPPTPTAASGVQASVCLWEVTAPPPRYEHRVRLRC